MEVGIGLPTTIPATGRDQVLAWARRAEARGFSMLGTIDRLVYDSHEPLIALDIEQMVQDLGHRVTGIARTHKEAVSLFQTSQPKMVLADIQLADGSSGIDAVNELLRELGDIPVIFITAFPERLLTGERPEPAFLISKPYSEEQVRSAVSQAMFFASTEGLDAA